MGRLNAALNCQFPFRLRETCRQRSDTISSDAAIALITIESKLLSGMRDKVGDEKLINSQLPSTNLKVRYVLLRYGIALPWLLSAIFTGFLAGFKKFVKY